MIKRPSKPMAVTTSPPDTLSGQHHGPCKWWYAYLFDNPLRRILHPATPILGPYVKPGMRVLDFGCGFGHFAIGMAELIHTHGKVIAVDVQTEMLSQALKRAKWRKVDERIEFRLLESSAIAQVGPIDFALACNVLHEVPNPGQVCRDIFTLLPPGGLFYVMEPRGHLERGDFEIEVEIAVAAGFEIAERPNVIREDCVLLRKPDMTRLLEPDDHNELD